MSLDDGSSLDPDLMALLDGTDLGAKVGETILLLTVSETGWPHVGMLSVGEVLATDPDRVVIALWQGTRTGSNLLRTSKGTLALVHRGAGYYIELSVTGAGPVEVDETTLDSFSCSVTRVLRDEVDYATLTSGIRFELPREDEVVARWERTMTALRGS